MERLDYFALEGMVRENGQQLGEPVRHMVVLTSLIGCQRVDTFREILPSAPDGRLTPVTVKEIAYQSVDYTGIERMHPSLLATNGVLEGQEVPLPLSGQTTTTIEDRLEKGSQARVGIFSEGVRGFWRKRHVDRWLAANCFGDHYTHRGLDFTQREPITSCSLVVQDGCELQLINHAAANVRFRNMKEYSMKVIPQCLPYTGYPCSLSAVACVEKI